MLARLGPRLRLAGVRCQSGAAAAGAATAGAGAGAGPTAPYEMLRVERRAGGSVALLTLHRPKALNALCAQLIAEINAGARRARAAAAARSEHCRSADHSEAHASRTSSPPSSLEETHAP